MEPIAQTMPDSKQQRNQRFQPRKKRLDHLPLEHHAQVGIHRFEFAVRKNHGRLPSGSIIEGRSKCRAQSSHRAGAAGSLGFDALLFRERREDAVG